MKRRDFVKTASAASASLLLSSPFSLQTQEKKAASIAEVKRVLVMFKCHFDAGFIDTQANVVNKYFKQYFPQAIEIARSANAGGNRRYVWTTGSWLLYEYLEQASAADRKAMEDAIARHDIAWHALPFTWQTELLSPSMIEGALGLSHSLDRRFGQVTTGAKMTDVPGHTRGLIAPLASHGVGFLNIGVNEVSTPAQLPPMFLWQDSDGKSLPVMYHRNYGGTARIPGSDTVIAVRVRGDNSGPHMAEEIAKIHAELAAQFPNAEIIATNLSEIADAVQPHRGSLPVVTKEIGDTWIHGCSSDPLKMARFREICRLRETWVAAGAFHVGDPTDLAFLRHILLEAEHTWGVSTDDWLDFNNLKPADLARSLDTKNYKVAEFSWQEKRQDLLDGIATLPAELREEASRAIETMAPRPIEVSAGTPVRDGELIDTTHFLLRIDPQTGAIIRLYNKKTGREWARPTNSIALITYQTLSKGDYDRFMAAYLTSTPDWAYVDYGKPNIDRCGALSQDWHPASASIRMEKCLAAHRILVDLHFNDEEAFQSGRASFPRILSMALTLPKNDASVGIDVYWSQKPATRLPEGLWLTFNPIAEDPRGWSLHKSGQAVSPFDVVPSGNRVMHSLSNGFEYRHANHILAVETPDAPVVALGNRTPLGFTTAQPDLSTGIHSSLFNNAWGTNYIMWYAEDARFRFTLRA